MNKSNWSNKSDERKEKGFSSVAEVLQKIDLNKNRYISREFQDYGYKLSEELGDLEHKALYIKLAKELPRKVLEEAKNFVKDHSRPKNKGKLFMWRIKQTK